MIEISTSKIRNNTEIIKNCIENGIRFEILPRKPHSNPDLNDFFRLLLYIVFFNKKNNI